MFPRGHHQVVLAQLRVRSRLFSSASGNVTKWPHVAVVGIGQLGAAVACNLARHNVPTTLYDLSKDKNVPAALREQFAQNEASGKLAWAASGAEAAARAEVVFTALPKPEHVSAAMEGSSAGNDGILAGIKKGTVWVDHSTTDFENTLRVKELVEQRGGHAVEAPLTGGMQILRAGKMVALVGAYPEVLDSRNMFSRHPGQSGSDARVSDVIALSAPRIVRCGTFGHATIIKIFSNILCAAHDVAVGETLCVAKKAGLDMKLVFDAMRVSSGNSFCWETEVPRMLKGDYYPDFTAQMMHKDISLGEELGKKYGVPLPMNDFIKKAYEDAMERYGTHSGSSIPCRMVEDAAGCRLNDADDEKCERSGRPVVVNQPGNKVNDAAHGGAFGKWSYTTDLADGSYVVKHVGEYSNPYLNDEWVGHAGMDELVGLRQEVAALRRRLAEIEGSVK